MLNSLKMPYVAERLLGVTIPECSVMYACSYEGLHKIVLEDPVRVETDKERSEDYEMLRSKGDALGLFGGTPILTDSRTQISYVFDPRAKDQRIEVRQAGSSEVITFATLSGDWFIATLSKCGQFLVLAEPYAIEVRKTV